MLTDYAAPEMLGSMKELRAWQLSRPGDFDSTFKALLLKADKSKEEIELEARLDSSRRRVSQFFTKLHVLSQLHVIDEREIGLTWGTGTYTFVADVLIPMETAKTNALFATGSITSQDKARAEIIQKGTLAFYRRVFQERLDQ